MKTPRISNVVTCLLLIAFLIVAFADFISPNSNLPVLSHAQNLQNSTTFNTEVDGAKHDERVVEYAKMNRAVMRDIKFDSATTRIDFEYDRVEVILKQGFSKGTINAKSFLSISNIKSAEGIIAEDIVNAETEKTRNDRFRQIITIKLEKTGRDKVLEAVAELEKLDEVLVAQPSYIYEGGDDWFPPNDPLYGGANHDQWGLRGANGIKAEQAWAITKGDTNPLLRIGIFETGIQIDHPDLRVVPGNFTPEEGASSDHGTHVGGTIGAITHNDRGIAGIAQVELSLLNRSTFRESLEWADAQGISIVNASYWHDRPTVNDSGEVTRQAVPDALNFQAIANYSGLFVASAGNQGLNNDVFPQYPAAYDLPNLIAVGSIDENGGESSFSNFGADSVDIFAPGGSVLSSFPVRRCAEGSFLGIRKCEDNQFLWWGAKTTHIADGYHRASGTSFAAPHVAGVAALILSKYPHFRPSQIKTAIMWGVDLVPALSNRCVAGGRLNAAGALANAALFPPPQIRYIRDWANGSTVNTDNHWVQIGAYESRDSDTPWSVGAGNWAYIGDYPRPNAVTASTPLSLYGASTNMWGANRIINGDIDSSQYVATSGNGLEWIQVDLGQLRTVRQIWIWHYYADSRIYYQTRTQVSADGITWFDAFNSTTHGTYHETVASNRIWL